jgi:hypothetical protein
VQMGDLKRKVSVVHQDIDRPIPLPSGLDHKINLFFARYVSLKKHAFAARALNFIENSFRGFPVLMIIDDHPCAGLAEPLRRRRAYSTAPAGDENDFFPKLRMILFPGHGAAIRSYMAMASSAAPFSYFAALFLNERNFILT